MKQMESQAFGQMMQFITGKWISKPIYVAAKLGIPDMLADGPKSIEDLAQMTSTNASVLYRVMRALSSVGIFNETNDKMFDLTPMAECLKAGALRSAALMFHSPWHENAWNSLLDSVKTGDVAFEKVHGMTITKWLENNPKDTEILSQANAIKAKTSHSAIVNAYDFKGIDSLTDVGGGYGALIMEILESNKSMKGIVAELPNVATGAKKALKEGRMEERCQVVDCDFFKEIPGGSDAYLMSHIIHDWNDERCRIILKNCHKAMRPDAKLLLVEAIVPSGNEFSIAKLLDLEVFVINGGQERTEEEYKDLLESSGFILSRIIPTKESISILEAIRF